METLNLSESYPKKDIQKRNHTSILLLAMMLLVAGVLLFLLPTGDSESNWDALRVCVGCFSIVCALYLFFFKRQYQAYAPTGSAVSKKRVMCSPKRLASLQAFLSQYSPLKGTSIMGEKDPVSLVWVYSKDQKYVAFQLLRYASFLYEPISDVYQLSDDEASAFLCELKKENYEF